MAYGIRGTNESGGEPGRGMEARGGKAEVVRQRERWFLAGGMERDFPDAILGMVRACGVNAGAQEMGMNHRVLLGMGIGFDAASSVWASLKRKMVRGEGFEPPTNSV